MTDTPNRPSATVALNAHHADRLPITYETDGAHRWAVITLDDRGRVTVALHGDHAVTAEALVIAAAQAIPHLDEAGRHKLNAAAHGLWAAMMSATFEDPYVHPIPPPELSAPQRAHGEPYHGMCLASLAPLAGDEDDRGVCVLEARHDGDHRTAAEVGRIGEAEPDVLRDERDRALDRLDQAGVAL